MNPLVLCSILVDTYAIERNFEGLSSEEFFSLNKNNTGGNSAVYSKLEHSAVHGTPISVSKKNWQPSPTP